MRLRVVIVDDEPLARERVRTFLAEEPDVEILAECADGAEAVNRIEELRPDVLFLDVQMPRLNGFEVLEAIDAGAMPAAIFTTAQDDHAIRAPEPHQGTATHRGRRIRRHPQDRRAIEHDV